MAGVPRGGFPARFFGATVEMREMESQSPSRPALTFIEVAKMVILCESFFGETFPKLTLTFLVRVATEGNESLTIYSLFFFFEHFPAFLHQGLLKVDKTM